jgi:transposase
MQQHEGHPGSIFRYVSAEQRLPQDHPLRAIRALVNDVLRDMSPEIDRLYASGDRTSVPPEQLLRAQLLQVLYSIRSERLLMDQMDYNLLFRWFVGLEIDEPTWRMTAFVTDRDRLLKQNIASNFLRRVVARAQDLMSDQYFTVDETLLQTWVS